MEVGKTNDKSLKAQETLKSVENEMNILKHSLEEAEKRANETEAKLQKV